MKRELRGLLGGGDRRSIGRSTEAVAVVAREPARFGELIECMFDADPLIAMRAADAAEKASRANPALLGPYKRELLGLLGEARQAEVRWHLAQMVPRLRLSQKDRQLAASLLETYLDDRSSIVKTWAMQALVDLSEQDPGLRETAERVLTAVARHGPPAMRARVRRLQSTPSRKRSQSPKGNRSSAPSTKSSKAR